MKKISAEKDLLFNLFLYLDPEPFNKASEELLKDQSFWKKKLEMERIEVVTNIADYRKLYAYYKNFNDPTKAFEKAIENQDEEILLELGRFVDKDFLSNSLSKFTKINNPKGYAELLESRNLICELVNSTSLNFITKSSILQHFELSNLSSCINSLMDSQTAKYLDRIGIVFPRTMIENFDLPESTKYYTETQHIDRNNYQSILQNSIKKSFNSTANLLIEKFQPTDANPFLYLAIKYDNQEMVKIFLNTERKIQDIVLTEIIRKNNIPMAKILKQYFTKQHLKIANNLNRPEIYNILSF